VKPINDPVLLQRALKVAAEMLAQQSQLYDEISTPEEWIAELLSRAREERALQEEQAHTGQLMMA